MQSNWPNSRDWTLVHEGGYVNHPKDPGGATNRGVTQRVYDAYRKRQDLPAQSVRSITDEEVHTIYHRQYWGRIQGDELPAGVDYAVYDFAVNSGVSRAAKYLQRVVGVTQDGDIGQMTLAAVAAMPPEEVIRQLCADRMSFLRQLRHWGTFGRGWTRRVEGEKAGFQERDTGVLDRAVMLARGAQNIPAPIERADGAAAKGEGPKGALSTVKDAIKDPAGGSAVLASSGGVLAAVSEPPLAYFVGCALFLAVAAAVYVMVRKANA